MKLKNKRTGKIVEWFNNTDGILPNTLAELNAEWEDYEEPKDYYVINLWGEVSVEDGKYQRPGLSELGLTFETEEEAEKAVEKLKAWKRLKDKGFRFDGYDVANRVGDDVICGQVYFKAGNYDREEIEEDLYLLFGGEE